MEEINTNNQDGKKSTENSDKTNPKPDDRRDNVEKLQYSIDRTIHNIEAAEEMIQKTPDKTLKQDLLEKNERRRSSLEKMRDEIRDEAHAREQHYEE